MEGGLVGSLVVVMVEEERKKEMDRNEFYNNLHVKI